MSTAAVNLAAQATKSAGKGVLGTRQSIANAFELELNFDLVYDKVGRKFNNGERIVRLAAKDNLAWHATTCGSKALRRYQSPLHATSIKRLRNSKRIGPVALVGKTRMDEFGMGSHSINTYRQPPVNNIEPFEKRSAGGSSGGSAVAVASDLSDLALGSDTGGSVRLPAAYTGVIGFKPSYGRVSRHGLVSYANSLDTVGLLCRHLELLRMAFGDIDGGDPKDPTCISEESRRRFDARLKSQDSFKDAMEHSDSDSKSPSEASTTDIQVRRIRIGYPLEYNIVELEGAVRLGWKDVLKVLQNDKYEVVPISLPSTKHALPAYYVLAAAEAASNLAKYDGVRFGSRQGSTDNGGNVLFSQSRGRLLGDEVQRRILLGSYTLSSEAIDNHFIQAQRVRRLVQRDFDRVFLQKNPLHPGEQFDLSGMDEEINLESKLGPAQVDFILCPTAPTRSPFIGAVKAQASVRAYMNDVFTVPASLAGLPSISIPVGMSRRHSGTNVPWIGMQLIGQYWDDDRVINIARDVLRLWELHVEGRGGWHLEASRFRRTDFAEKVKSHQPKDVNMETKDGAGKDAILETPHC